MKNTRLMLLDGGGVKSLNLANWPHGAWQFIYGSEDTAGGELDVFTAYQVVPWLFRGVNAIADAVSNLPYRFVRGEDEIDLEEAGDLLPFEVDWVELLNQWAGWLIMYGAAYAHMGSNRIGRMKFLQPLAPGTMSPQFDRERGLVGFKRAVGGELIPMDVDEVLYRWVPNRKSELGPGTPPAKAALAAAGVIRNIDLFSAGYFQRGAVNSFLMTVPDDTSEADKERLETWGKRFLSGVKNAFGIRVVRTGVDIKQLGGQPSDLAMPELTDKKREDIATALGVPHSLLFSSAANYATAEQDDKHFYDKTVIPLARGILRSWNNQLFKPLGLEMKERHDLLEMYQDDESDKAYRLLAAVNAGAMPPSEFRMQMNLEELAPEDQEMAYEHLRRIAIAQAGQTPDDAQAKLEAELERAKNPPQPFGAPPVQLAQEQAELQHAEDGTQEPNSETQAIGKAATLEGDLSKWQAKALRRWAEGKPGKALDFVSAAIPAALASAIRGGLEVAQSEADIKAAFIWGAYP